MAALWRERPGPVRMSRLSRLSRSIAGQVAIVTGAASGMGRATSYLLADEVARVAVTDVVDPGEVVEAITEAGGQARGWVLDVADAEAVTRVVAEIVACFGRIDILVNNAGISRRTPFPGEDWTAAWVNSLAVNLTGEALMIRACLPHLQATGAGRVVIIASTEGLGATAGASPYTASKHGVIGLTRALAVELGRTGVTFNCICPGPIRTGMTAVIPEDAKQVFAHRRVPLRRYGEPEEVAQMTLSLCLPAASYCNGAVLVVDGGMLAQNT
jgi:3-oxoacyl-[acyl-carrier protein] reductase